MVTEASSRMDPAARLGVACLVNAGRWNEVEPFVARFNGLEHTSDIALALASARVRNGRWDEAIEGLSAACQRHGSNGPLREFALRILMARADDRVRAQAWQEASALIDKALAVDSKHPPALKMRSTLLATGPRAQLQSGDRAQTAALWEREFVAERKTETAHHLAILYFWWAAHETSGEMVRIATLWQRSIGWWVYALNDADYWEEWIDRKKPAYSIEREAAVDLRSNVRRQLEERITGLAGSLPGVSQRMVDDLAMDCWAEFEVAEHLREAGVEKPYGPLLMHLLGAPPVPDREASAQHDRLTRLGDCVLPFIPDTDALLKLCQGGLSRALAYLANGRHDRAMAIAMGQLSSLPVGDPVRSLTAEMCAYIEILHAEDVYVRLKCPPEDAGGSRIAEYAQQVGAVIEGLAEVQSQITSNDSSQAMERLIELIGRRTYNEFSSFSADTARRGEILEAGIEILDRALRLSKGGPSADETRLYLAAMLNRLALHIGSEEHDRVISLLERASQWAPENPNYRRNLAFSYFNRYAARKQRDADRLGAREDIKRAHQLAPYDADIRAEFELMHGSGRA